MGLGQRLLVVLGAILIASAVWLMLDPPSPAEDQPSASSQGNPCSSTILQAFGGRSDDMLDATESRVCTTPARKQLAVAVGLFVVGVSLVVGARSGDDREGTSERALDHYRA